MATQNAVLDMGAACPPLLKKPESKKDPVVALLERLFHNGFCDPWQQSGKAQDHGVPDVGNSKEAMVTNTEVGKSCEETHSVSLDDDDSSTILSTSSSPVPGNTGVAKEVMVEGQSIQDDEDEQQAEAGASNVFSATMLLVLVIMVACFLANQGGSNSGRVLDGIQGFTVDKDGLLSTKNMGSTSKKPRKRFTKKKKGSAM